MNAPMQLISLELAVAGLALLVLVLDLWTPAAHKPKLGYLAAAGVVGILLASLFNQTDPAPGGVALAEFGFNKMYVADGLATYFKQFFLLAAALVLLISIDFADRIQSGIGEFYALILFALAGMMFAASANDFVLVFVSLELITITFYVLTSFQRARLLSLEAGLKYLILGALSTAFTVFGIAFVFGSTGATNFSAIAAVAKNFTTDPIFLVGLVCVLAGLGFKIAAFPFQFWAPDVYQGSPAPVTAFLAVGSKAAGFVLLLRVLFSAVPAVINHWSHLLMGLAALTILYGNLCAVPQRSLKRLMGYSSISHAGYLLLGVAALSTAGVGAVIFYLTGYLFTVVAAFTVIAVVTRNTESDDISVLAGLGQRSPLLAAGLTLSMVSLAGIPPLAGFFGKFLLLKSILEKGGAHHGYYCLALVAVAGVVISLYYYGGVIRAIYWSRETPDLSPLPISLPTAICLWVCIAGMFALGVNPDPVVVRSTQAARSVEGKIISAAVPPQGPGR